jgi:glycosyltransferase involved in cell wall biosynthesis
MLVHAIARTPALAPPAETDLAAVATALAANRKRFGLPQILLDITNVVSSDLRTGIEGATRGVLMALIADPPPGYRIEPIRAVAGGYLYARRFACQSLGLADDNLTDEPVETGRGDIFIGLNWCPSLVASFKPWFMRQRWRGAQIFFVVYDLLPLLRPEFFPPGMEQVVLEWVNTVAEAANGAICISRAVADELYGWLVGAGPWRREPLSLGFFHLGADLNASLPTTGKGQDVSTVFAKLRVRPSFLMVGTVEPGKGHRQALAAMEGLWTEGVDAHLVIIGKQGRMIDDLAERIQRHPERDNRLFWVQEISEGMLEETYRSGSALLAASEGEGFGLTLIEAARHGLPIIARDIPVFREVAGEHAYYFRG